MFWGLIMEPQKRYSQTVKKSFHISHAAMDTATGDGDVCQVMVVVDGQNFLICTLQKGKIIQTPLDLFFREGENISFITNGKSHVHLTGYLDLEYDDLEEEEAEDEEGEEDEEVPDLVEQLSKKSKRKLEASPEVSKANKKQKKDKKKEVESKKSKKEESDDDSSDDDSVDIQKLLEEDDTDEADDSYLPNDASVDKLEEDDDESTDDEEDDDEDDDEDDSSEEKSTPEVATPSKKDKKEKNKQAQATPQQNGHVEKKNKIKENQQKGQGDAVTPQKEKKVLTGNVAIEDLRVGQGAAAKPGKMVQVLYEGRLKSNNKMFDSCQKNPGFKFRLGKNEVIKAWDVGVVGMRIGGKRRIVCPPGMAYGNKGSPPLIPPNSTLVFEVELKAVN